MGRPSGRPSYFSSATTDEIKSNFQKEAIEVVQMTVKVGNPDLQLAFKYHNALVPPATAPAAYRGLDP